MSTFAPMPADDGQAPPPPPRPRLPWEERSRIGLAEGFIQTVRLMILQPSDGFSRLRPDGDLTSPLLFGIIVSWLSMVASQLWSFIFSSSLRNLAGSYEGLEEIFQAPSAWGLVALTVFWPVLFLVIAFIGSAILHVCVLVVGGTERSEMGFEGTLKVYSYATVAWLAALVPIAGGIITTLWGLVLQVIGIAEAHRTTQGRALLAVLIPSLLCCACLVLVFVLFGAALIGAAQGMGASP